MSDIHSEFTSSLYFHEERIDRCSVDALVGLAAGLTADGAINQQKTEFLKRGCGA